MLVYKYRGGDDNIFKRDLESIEANTYWCASSEELNDPFETINIPDKFYKQTNFLTKIFGIQTKDTHQDLKTAFENLLSFDTKMGIYSLSKTWKDEILWTHYGNSHKGFCIEYDLDILLETYRTDKIYSFPIKYTSSPPEISLLDIPKGIQNGIIEKMAGYKSKRWEYEQEYRIITDRHGPQSYNFKALKSIYFGLRMSEQHKSKILKRLNGRGIKFYQMHQIEKSYKLEARQIPITINEVTYLRQIPSTITKGNPINYEIIERQYSKFNGKATSTVLLNSKIKEGEIKWVAKTIKENLFQNAKRIFISYFIKDQKDRGMAWVTSNFDSDELSIYINDHVEI